MKKLSFLSLLLLSACATEFKIIEEDVPVAVLSAFKVKYPNALDTKWEAERSDKRLVFEAEFKNDGKKKEAYFKPDGTFLREE